MRRRYDTKERVRDPIIDPAPQQDESFNCVTDVVMQSDVEVAVRALPEEVEDERANESPPNPPAEKRICTTFCLGTQSSKLQF